MSTRTFLDLLFKALCVCLFLFNRVYVSADNDQTPTHESGFSSGEWWIPSAIPTAVASNISELCLKHSLEYLTALRSHLPWALQSKFSTLLP